MAYIMQRVCVSNYIRQNKENDIGGSTSSIDVGERVEARFHTKDVHARKVQHLRHTCVWDYPTK